MNCFAMSDEDSRRKAGSIGKPMMFTEAKGVDPEGSQVATNEVGELVPSFPSHFRNSSAMNSGSLVSGSGAV